jgi:hypothetical protein
MQANIGKQFRYRDKRPGVFPVRWRIHDYVTASFMGNTEITPKAGIRRRRVEGVLLEGELCLQPVFQGFKSSRHAFCPVVSNG